PRARDVPRVADEIREILVAVALLVALLAQLHPFGAERGRTGTPVELRAEPLAAALDVDALEEIRRAKEALAAEAVQPFRHIRVRVGDAEVGAAQAADARNGAKQIAGHAHGIRRPNVVEIVAFLDKLGLARLGVVAVIVEDAGFVAEPAERAARHHAGVAPRRDALRSERAIREVELADAGVLLHPERHLEAAGLDPHRVESLPPHVHVFPLAELDAALALFEVAGADLALDFPVDVLGQ